MLDELGKLHFARFRFHLRAQTPLCLPPYKGSTLRGGFGMAFKDGVCVVVHRDCEPAASLLAAPCGAIAREASRAISGTGHQLLEANPWES
jgi:hypothetical protein